jgi:hypothetical protein
MFVFALELLIRIVSILEAAFSKNYSIYHFLLKTACLRQINSKLVGAVHIFSKKILKSYKSLRNRCSYSILLIFLVLNFHPKGEGKSLRERHFGEGLWVEKTKKSCQM